MCGIVGYVGDKSAVGIIVEGLKRLEYRGYDSAGIAVLNDGTLHVRRAAGRLKNLEGVLGERPLTGSLGIGHTRWATHGRPSEENAHPHTDCDGSLVVVHNGIIENYLEIKDHLLSDGHRFKSETDTEVLAHLIEHHLRGTRRLDHAVKAAMKMYCAQNGTDLSELTEEFYVRTVNRSPFKIFLRKYQPKPRSKKHFALRAPP